MVDSDAADWRTGLLYLSPYTLIVASISCSLMIKLRIDVMLSLDGCYAPTVLGGSKSGAFDLGHFHDQGLWELVLVEDGLHRIDGSGTTHRLLPGDVYLLQPGHAYILKHGDAAHFAHLGFIVRAARLEPIDGAFGLRLVEPEVQPDALGTWDRPLPLHLRLFEPEYLGNEIRYMIDLIQQGAAGHLTAGARLVRLLEMLVRSKESRFADTNPAEPLDKIAAAERAIINRVGQYPRVADVAAAVSISCGHFSRLFKAQRGEAAGEFLRRVRLQTAMHLLRTTDQSIADVAQAVGYRSTSAMDHAFQAANARSPRQWRIAARRAGIDDPL